MSVNLTAEGKLKACMNPEGKEFIEYENRVSLSDKKNIFDQESTDGPRQIYVHNDLATPVEGISQVTRPRTGKNRASSVIMDFPYQRMRDPFKKKCSLFAEKLNKLMEDHPDRYRRSSFSYVHNVYP